MTQNLVAIDADRLRAAAGRIEQSAAALARFTVPQLDPDALAGSLVSGVARPAWMASRLPDLQASVQWWADTARLSASAFSGVDGDNSARM